MKQQQKTLRITFEGSCWPTNIGNAFVNLGAIYSLKMALGSHGVVDHIGGMSDYLFRSKGKPENSLIFAEYISSDYLVNAGMTMCREHLVARVPIYQQYAERGIKIILLGGGAGRYTHTEVKEVREAMKAFPVYALISRDSYTFEQYGDLALHAYNGIDSAFFIADCFQPIPLTLPEFHVVTFESPHIPAIDHKERLVIHTHHTCWPTFLTEGYFEYPQTLISDLPSDYLTLYAQASITYSERVHACIPALSFGRHAQLFLDNSDKRLLIFQRVGVPEIYRRPVQLDLEFINREKERQVHFLKHIILDEEAPFKDSTYTITQEGEQDKEIPLSSPECSLFLFLSELSPSLFETIDSILSQTIFHIQLTIIDLCDPGVHNLQRVIETIKDKRIRYQKSVPSSLFSDVFEQAESPYVVYIRPNMIYTSYFLYELRACLNRHQDSILAYSLCAFEQDTPSSNTEELSGTPGTDSELWCCIFRKDNIAQILLPGRTLYDLKRGLLRNFPESPRYYRSHRALFRKVAFPNQTSKKTLLGMKRIYSKGVRAIGKIKRALRRGFH